MKNFMMILQMIPAIVGLVQHAETLIPGRGNGKQKLDLVLSNVSAVAQAVPEVSQAISASDLNQAVTLVASTTVTALKAAGIFKGAADAVATAK